MRQKLVAGNWKMNGSLGLVNAFCDRFQNANFNSDVLIIPPFLYVPELVANKSESLRVGVQNLSSHKSGAYTGEISLSMAEEFQVDYALYGHSERREYFGETDDLVSDKIKLAVTDSKIKPILCVGETLSERESDNAFVVVERQVKAIFDKLTSGELTNIVIAYEPVWAIGTGLTATPAQAQEMHAFIRQQVATYDENAADTIKLLYGGSVNAGNAETLFKQKDIDGALVGGASLKVEEFFEICKLAG